MVSVPLFLHRDTKYTMFYLFCNDCAKKEHFLHTINNKFWDSQVYFMYLCGPD